MKRIISILTLIAMMMAACTFALSCAVAETGSAVYSADDLFTSRDYSQTADLSEAVSCTLSDGQDIEIATAGVYVISGSASDVTILVDAAEDDKVQIVLDGTSIVNADSPAIYVKTADKVFITTSTDSTLSVTGTFTADGDTNTDGVIFSKSNLVLNGTAKLTLSSTDNGVVCKDDLKVTGGSYDITAASKAIEANDSIRISDGTLSLTAGTDGLHAENDDDDTLGYVYIGGGSLSINAGDDGIHAVSVVQIDGGEITVSAKEGIEGTYIQINGGTLVIQSSDDGINAAHKSGAWAPTIEINDGDITINMGAGDTDGVDSNSDVIINGGTIRINGMSSFDYDGISQYNGGTIIVNGEQIAYIPNQMMGGGMGGSWASASGMGGGRAGGGMNGNMGGGRAGGGMNGGMGGRGGW